MNSVPLLCYYWCLNRQGGFLTTGLYKCHLSKLQGEIKLETHGEQQGRTQSWLCG